MSRTVHSMLLALALAAPVAGAGQTDAAVTAGAGTDWVRGELLYENHCSACHGEGVHFREGRKAGTRAELRAFVVRWQRELELGWTAAEIDDVGAFLDRRYYRFATSQ